MVTTSSSRPDLSTSDGKWAFIESLGLKADLETLKALAKQIPQDEMLLESRSQEVADLKRKLLDREKDLEVELLDEPLPSLVENDGTAKKMLAEERKQRLEARLRQRALTDKVMDGIRKQVFIISTALQGLQSKVSQERMEWQLLNRKLDLRGRVVSFLETR